MNFWPVQCRARVIKMVWYRQKNRNADQWSRLESPEVNSHSCGHIVYDKGGENNECRKGISSISGAGKSGQLHVKNEIRIHPNTVYKNKLKMD